MSSLDNERFYQEEEDYASLADERNDEDSPDWIESHWDEEAVRNAKAYAARNKLRWPPQMGDFDRYWEKKNAVR